jgi:hypothetical protein
MKETPSISWDAKIVRKITFPGSLLKEWRAKEDLHVILWKVSQGVRHYEMK